MKGVLRERLVLLLAAFALRTEEEKSGDEQNTDNDDDDKSDKKTDHCRCKGFIGARVDPRNKSVEYRHD